MCEAGSKTRVRALSGQSKEESHGHFTKRERPCSRRDPGSEKGKPYPIARPSDEVQVVAAASDDAMEACSASEGLEGVGGGRGKHKTRARNPKPRLRVSKLWCAKALDFY